VRLSTSEVAPASVTGGGRFQDVKKKLLIALLVLAAFTAVYFLREARRVTPGRGAPDSPGLGTNAPDFAVTDSNGKTQSVSQYKGNYVVLEWFNPECPFVKKHYGSGNMQKLQEEFTGKGIVWLTIDSSAPGKQGHLTSKEANEKITNLKMKSTALVLDADGKAGQTYGAKNTPHMFVINPEGNIVYEGAIDSRNSTSAADIPNATNYVKVALDESLAGKAVSNAITRPYGCSVKYN
jgi:peroxiredoxin